MIDSSAALRAAASTSAATSLAGWNLVAPPLFWSEVTSAVHEALWRREIDRVRADATRSGVAALAVRRLAPASLHDEAWRIADELGWAKTYDAEFLALARLRGCLVLTTDARLRRGGARTGLVIAPDELPPPPGVG